MNEKDVGYYKSLPYRRRVRPERDSSGSDYFVAWVEEVPWIKVDGPTREESLRRLEDVFAEGIRAMIEAGDEIEEPVRWPESVGHAPARPRRGMKLFGGSFAKYSDPPEADVKTLDATSEEGWKDIETREVETAGSR